MATGVTRREFLRTGAAAAAAAAAPLAFPGPAAAARPATRTLGRTGLAVSQLGMGVMITSRIAVEKGIPLFHGGISGFFGQATTILPGETPCLRCIFPNPPPVEVFPVAGVTAGFIGTVQATEVCKYLLGHGELLANRLLLGDGMKARVDEIAVEKDPSCEVCADRTAGEL